MRHDANDDPAERPDDGIDDEEQPTADILPTDAPRGAQTIPDTTDTGITTPPVSGWGETLEGDEVEPETSTDPRPR